MQSIEPRNEQLMLRQFWKKHPTYNLNAMMRRRYEELMDAKAFFCFARSLHCSTARVYMTGGFHPAILDGKDYSVRPKLGGKQRKAKPKEPQRKIMTPQSPLTQLRH